MTPPAQPGSTDIIETLYDFNSKLPTDEFILRRFKGRSPLVLPKFQQRHPECGLPYAVLLARRAIEIGIVSAQDEIQKSVARDIADFDNINAAATTAEAALQELISALDPNAKTEEYLKLPLTTVSAGLSSEPESAAKNLPRRIKQIAEDATILWRSRELVGKIKANSGRKSTRLSRARKNDPKPEERVFLLPLAEMWTHLTGGRPGKSENAEKNPFLEFVHQCWNMAFPSDGNDRVFKGALRFALNHLDKDKIALLVSAGPSWK